MKTCSLLFWLSLTLDVLGALFAALLVAQLLHQNPALVFEADGLAFGLVFSLMAWFFGGYSFLVPGCRFGRWYNGG